MQQLETSWRSPLRRFQFELEKPGGIYALLPFNLISLVLNEVVSDKGEIILVAPIWQTQAKVALLLSLLVQHPVLLPNKEHLLINPVGPHLVHPMHPRLHLDVFHISSTITREKAFLHKLPVYSSQPLVYFASHAKHIFETEELEQLVFFKGNWSSFNIFESYPLLSSWFLSLRSAVSIYQRVWFNVVFCLSKNWWLRNIGRHYFAKTLLIIVKPGLAPL